MSSPWFFAYFDVVNIGYALPTITEQFGTRTSVVAAATLSLLGCVLGALVDGTLADRYGRRNTLILSVTTYSLGTIIAACAPDLTVLAVGRFITGIGIGAEIAVASAYVAELAPAGMRGRVTSVIVLYGYCAFALIPFVALFLLSNFEAGWRVLLLIGALGALIVLPFRATLSASPRWMIARVAMTRLRPRWPSARRGWVLRRFPGSPPSAGTGRITRLSEVRGALPGYLAHVPDR